MKTIHFTITYFLVLAIISAQCSKVLVVAPMPFHSQFTVAFRLAKELAARGHEVTCINSYPQEVPIKNYKDVSVKENVELAKEVTEKLFSSEKMGLWENLTSVFDMILAIIEATLKHKNVQQLLQSEESFDVVIAEHFMNEAFVGFGYHFKAPVILISATYSSAMNNKFFANPAPLSYVPGMGGDLTRRMDFWQRIQNLLMNAVFNSLIEFYHLPQQNRIFREIFKSDCDLDNVLYNNISLMLTNSHVSVSDAVPHVPSIIEIGGFHINPQNKLPHNLQKFLDNAEEGVILFSMGSALQSKDLTPETRKAILTTFSKIKQKVLWKFETDLSETPENVKIMKWIPQQDVLAHPNVRAFITHGGFLSTLESVYYGVPIIGIPVFGDQNHNVATAVLNGYAVSLSLDELSSEEKLLWAINEILNNSKYRENVQQRSKLIRDQPLKPIDSAVFWVEHVIRYKGAPHLRSAGLDLKWYQREMIDIILFLTAVILVTVTTSYVLIKKILCFILIKKKDKKTKHE